MYPRTLRILESGSTFQRVGSMTASQLLEEEGLAWKDAAEASNALSMAEYVYNYPDMPAEGAKIVLHQLKLDLVASSNFSWRLAHNKMLLRRFIALGNLKKTQPPIDEDQKLALLHAPFTGTTLFGEELAKLREANTKCANAVTVHPTTAPLPPIPRGGRTSYQCLPTSTDVYPIWHQCQLL